jgi:hypothetical protein
VAFRRKQSGLDKCTGYFYEGKEIVLHKKTGTPTKQARHRGAWWPEDKRIEAATVFAVTRNFTQVAQLTGIPERIVKKMSVEPWWSECISKVQKLKNDELDSKLTLALEKALDIVIDRMDNGEIYVDRKTKDEYRVPVNLKNVSVTTDILFDKRQLLRGEATSRSEGGPSQEQKLLALKDQFEKLAQSKGINTNSEIIEGVILDETEETTTKEIDVQETIQDVIIQTNAEEQDVLIEKVA